MLRESPDGLAGTCVYKPHLFQAGTIDTLLRDFQEVLKRMMTEPEQPISDCRLPAIVTLVGCGAGPAGATLRTWVREL